MNWFKSLFCKHTYVFVRNIYGDEIIYRNFNRSMWCCNKCWKVRDFPNLVKEP